MTGFELWTSGIGSDRSTNWATTTALHLQLFLYSDSLSTEMLNFPCPCVALFFSFLHFLGIISVYCWYLFLWQFDAYFSKISFFFHLYLYLCFILQVSLYTFLSLSLFLYDKTCSSFAILTDFWINVNQIFVKVKESHLCKSVAFNFCIFFLFQTYDDDDDSDSATFSSKCQLILFKAAAAVAVFKYILKW